MTSMIEITRNADAALCHWPDSVSVDDERHPLGNHQYRDLRWVTSEEAVRVAELETELVERVRSAASPEDEMNLVDDELYDDPDGLLGLDLGVAGAVAALAAIGCIPVASCNGGAFGGWHHEDHPLVVFYAPKSLVPTLLRAAAETSTGLDNHDGALMLYAEAVDGPMAFARIIRTPPD